MPSEVAIVRWRGAEARAQGDSLAEEEPLEIALNGESLAITMRTPGDDFALAAGFLFAEGIITRSEQIAAMGYGTDPNDSDAQNLVQVTLTPGVLPSDFRARLERNFLATAACGVCGKANLDAVRLVAPALPPDAFRVDVRTLYDLPERMREAQAVFARTGGLHAACLFDGAGNPLGLKEDIGRHNAVDKLIGSEVMAGRLPLADRILLVSGRGGYEILQKAAVARIPIVCAVSAPSSLAVRIAQDLRITLVGFLRGETLNVYAHPERIIGTEA